MHAERKRKKQPQQAGWQPEVEARWTAGNVGGTARAWSAAVSGRRDCWSRSRKASHEEEEDGEVMVDVAYATIF